MLVDNTVKFLKKIRKKVEKSKSINDTSANVR